MTSASQLERGGPMPSQHSSSSSTSVVGYQGNDGYDPNSKTTTVNGEDQACIVDLARQLTQASLRATVTTDANPFLSPSPALDPNSPQFNVKAWARALFRAFSEDPEKYPRQSLGVSWRSLSVHGFGSDTAYQKTVLNVLSYGPQILKEWLSNRHQKVQILRNFDGLAKPGEMLLVLGRPGSGVTTLLKTISGQVHGIHLDDKSEFNYNGVSWHDMHKRFRGEVIYQAETDIHFPNLTVGQTLEFSALARTPSNRLPGVSRKMYARHLRDIVMSVFGISHTVNTRVGNDYIRGVSGGERKRVSIAEVTLNQSSIQCWDNSTRGLDSATALEFAKTLKLSTELADTVAIVSMYQASQAAYESFDKVLVLYEGRQIFFGPVNDAEQYFTNLGYHRPERQPTPDFLTSLTNPQERVVRPGFGDKVPRTPDEFASAWQNSIQRAQLLHDIDTFEAESALESDCTEKLKISQRARKSALSRDDSPYIISTPMQIHLCMIRGLQRLRGDKTFFVVTVLANFVMSLALGSIYYNLPPTADTLNQKCVILYFAILFNALSSALEIFSLYAQRPIVEKHSRYAMYHPFAEAIASIICDIPSKVMSTIAFNIPLYFLANLRREPGPFFVFLLFGFTCTLTMSMILRTIGQTSRTVQQALTPAAIFILGLVIYTGFVLPTQNMQYWLRWINYLDPIAYAYESLVANELSGRQFPCTQFVPMGPAYANITTAQMACSVSGAMPGEGFIDGDFYLGAAFEYYHSHTWRNFGILIAYIIFFLALYLLSSEYLSLDPSKGEILVYRSRRSKEKAIGASPIQDEETGAAESFPVSQRAEQNAPQIIKKDRAPGHIFHWKDVSYDIKIKGETRKILDNVDGWIKPGTLTALMGPTGAGKTSLFDVLADRVTMGIVSGDILVNGKVRGKAFQRQTGYVQQQDIHLETSTVREALRFSAQLRQPSSVSKEEKFAYVEDVIRLLEMDLYADAVIGIPGEGLNVEQRKRLTIAVELAAKPDLLVFLDEPTSGLDSQTSWSIITLIRKLSDNGQAILCTIHQPSALLFQQFDRLLLLAKGGRTVYFGDIGPKSSILTKYFESHGATPCGSNENPAEWMLSVMGAAPGMRTEIDWPEIWRQSKECSAVQTELNELAKGSGAGLEAQPTTYYAAPFHQQFLVVLMRVFQQYWRTPSYIYSKLILCGVTSIFIGASFYQAELSIAGLQHQMFSIFMLLVIFAFLVYQTMPHFILQRQQYEGRERSSRTYSWYVFVCSNLVVELPWNTLASLLVFFPFYYLTGMNNNGIETNSVTHRGGFMFFMIWSFLIFESTFADMVIAGVETAEVGAVLALFMFAMSLIFCGVMVSPSALPGFWIFMYRVSPFTYIVMAILSDGIAGQQINCSELELLRFQPAGGLTCGNYMSSFQQLAGGRLVDPEALSNCAFCPLDSTDTFLASINVFYDQHWRNLGLLWVYIIFNIFAALFLYWLARVPHKDTFQKLVGSKILQQVARFKF